jgi:tRNA (adenine22-N1)-methyltransferase
VYLIRSGRCPRVIASELNEKPFEQARFRVRLYDLEDKIEVRRGDGLKVLSPGEAQEVVVAGMGGNTIKQLLVAAPEVLNRLDRLVLQPAVDAGDLRLWLADNGWQLVDETLVEEKGRLYVALATEAGRETTRDRLLVEIGPRLVEKNDPLLIRYLEKLKEEYQRILSRLARSRSPAAREKAIEVTARLAKVREVLIKNGGRL